MKHLISILLALVLLLAAFLPGPQPALPADRAVMADALPFGTEPSPAPAASEGPDLAGVEYRHYDPAWFTAQTDALSALAEGGDADAVLALYDALYRELEHIDTLGAIAYTRYCEDVTDEYWAGEHEYCSGLLTQAADALSQACQRVTQGPCAGAFAAHVGAEAARALANYVPMTDREAELTRQEAELVDRYNSLMSGADSLSFPYRGRAWTWEQLTGLPGASFAAADYDGYLEVCYGLQRQLNDLVGPVFNQLVGVRAELAAIEGYASYADLAYEQIYGRDYGPAEAQILCDAVKAVSRDFYAALGQSPLWYGTAAVGPVPDPDALPEVLSQYVGRVDPALEDDLQCMRDRGLCDIGQGGDRFPGSFTVPLADCDGAYIFIHAKGDCTDFGTLAHEFGHFAYDLAHPDAGLLTGRPCFDLLEVHSTGLEALMTFCYDELYPQGAGTARFLTLGGLMQALAEGCVFDEFQRAVYADPDMTLDGMNRLFADICAQYGQEEPRDVDYSWMYVSHTFESPLYYISYAASALAAIQLWDLARTDWEAGADAWKTALEADACREGYGAVLSKCGLRLFTEPGAVADICRPLLEELERLDDCA